MRKINYEKMGIITSIIGATSMAIYGIFMGVYTSSYAILLDGSFNLISAILTIASIIIVSKISKGYTEKHPLGYYMYEVFMILVKGVFILGLIIVSVVSNIEILLLGGRELNLTAMLIYGIPALVINIVTCLICYYAYKKHKTGLLEIEYRAWVINSLITSIVVVSIVVVIFLEGTPFEILKKYIDQILIIILSIFTISMPINLIKSSFKELMLRQSSDYNKKPFDEFLKSENASDDNDFLAEHLSTFKIGRMRLITIGIKPKNDTMNMKNYKKLKNKIQDKAEEIYINVEVDLLII